MSSENRVCPGCPVFGFGNLLSINNTTTTPLILRPALQPFFVATRTEGSPSRSSVYSVLGTYRRIKHVRR